MMGGSTIKASDYIVEFLIQHGITDVFGYPGGMVTHLMESFDHYADQITAHLNYHEQACAMAACGWAEMTGLPGVAYATSGPGATNLLTGIACAYFESIPCLFITGQVNTYEQKGDMGVRQRGFQETDIVAMAAPVTKAAFMVTTAEELPFALERAYQTAMEERRGPVLIDIPMDVTRGEVPPDIMQKCAPVENTQTYVDAMAEELLSELGRASRPVILAGHGIRLSGMGDAFRSWVASTGIPVVTSMIAVDALPTDSPCNFGMIGAYGLRWANYMVNHSDCILTLGSRLDSRQTGVNKALFAPGAKILRVDIDPREAENRVKPDERLYCASLAEILPLLVQKTQVGQFDVTLWRERCALAREKLSGVDAVEPGNELVRDLSGLLPQDAAITTDVGQNQVWVAQSLRVKPGQRVLFSGGHGAMGYSLPCAIGAAIATKKSVICFVGDGGLQMNLQELQFVARERLPIKILLLNNHALGMIHHFQEMYFNSNYVQTDGSKGFTAPDFLGIAAAYGLRSVRYRAMSKIAPLLADREPVLIECALPQQTHVFPKLGMNRPIHEQEPPLPQALQTELADLLLNGPFR